MAILSRKKHKVLKRDGLLSFMLDAPDGKYKVTEPTNEQLADVLPWLIDQVITFGRDAGYCDYLNRGLVGILGQLHGDTEVKKFYASDGFDCLGYDRDGYNHKGLDRHGRNRDGFDEYGYDREGYDKNGRDSSGYDRDGFNARGVDRRGRTRDEVADEQVRSWTPAHQAMVAKLLQQKAAAAATEAEPVAQNA